MVDFSEKDILAKHKVKDKDYLIKICKKFGVKDWEKVYYANYNRDFRKKFPNPDLIHPGYIFRVPDKITGKKKITKIIKEIKKQNSELKKIRGNLPKEAKKRDREIRVRAKRTEDTVVVLKVAETLAMALLPLAGAAKAAIAGTKLTIGVGRIAVGILISKGILTTKLTAIALDKEESAFARIVKDASNYTSPSYWAVSLKDGMDHMEFVKKAEAEIKRLNGQDKHMLAYIDSAVEVNDSISKKLELTLQELDKL